MVLGVGTGWNPVEYEAMGADFANRGKVIDEQIVLLRRLWTESVVDFAGEFHRVDRAGLLPLPASPPPIWMGGFGRRPVDRAVRCGDGFIFGHYKGSEALAQYLRGQLIERGRDPAAFTIERTVQYQEGPAQWHEQAEIWTRLGASYISLYTMGPSGLHNPGPRLSSPLQHIEALKTFANEMRSYLVNPE